MIFVSIALLVVAAIALGVGIAASAVPPLVVSVLATLAAAGTLWGSFVHYRKEAAEKGLAVTGLGGNQARQPGYPQAYATPTGSPGPAPAAASTGNSAPLGVVPVGWDDLDEIDATENVTAFNLDELHEVRRHEVENQHRDAVLAAVDERIETLVALRRKLSRERAPVSR